jgi:galactokinase
VITENERTIAAAEALRAGDAELVGGLMNESHRSLREDFEVSSETLDAMAEAARSAEGCFGARLTGGGFAGCAVALVEATAISAFQLATAASYVERTGLACEIHVCRASDGVSVLPLPGDAS